MYAFSRLGTNASCTATDKVINDEKVITATLMCTVNHVMADKLDIVRSFLLDSPPGEFNDVFNGLLHVAYIRYQGYSESR
jgi:hypothetical protein